LRQSPNGCSVVLIQRPPDPLHATLKSLIRIAQEVYACAHPRPHMSEKVLAEISEYIPSAIVDQAQYFVAFVGILAEVIFRLVTYRLVT
jgi:hypothetical protein